MQGTQDTNHKHTPADRSRCTCDAEIVWFEQSFWTDVPGYGCDVEGKPSPAFNSEGWNSDDESEGMGW